MIETKIASTDGINQLHIYTFIPDGEIKAILQISHGMVEHIGRYKEFAEFLNKDGILVIGNDHLGHGYTAKEEDLGYFGSERSKTVVDDLYEVTKYSKKTYGQNLPYILLGHSMGSFMARRYLMTYGKELDGAIISGTGSQPGPVLSFGLGLAGLIKSIKGEKYHPDLLKTIAFGAYNKKINNPRTVSDWLCKDEKIVDIYCKDKFCSFDFTVDGYQTLFESIAFIQKKENIEKIPKNLPVLFFSGDMDPVGNYGKGVITAKKAFEKAGIKDVSMILYEGGRHEMLNEVERQDVYNDVLFWINEHIQNK